MRRSWAVIIMGWLMLGFIALALGMFLGTKANAQETPPKLTWTPPTQNEDRTPYTDPGGFRIYYGRHPHVMTTMVELPDTTNTLSMYDQVASWNLPNGTTFIAMTAYNSKGVESKLSKSVTRVVGPDPQPAPPDLLIRTSETVVYDLVKKDDGFVFVAVGNVELNTPCDINQSVMGKHVVPIGSVTSWLGSVRPKVVLAECWN